MITMLTRCAQALMTALRITAGTMLIASVAINFANIIGRYVFSVSISWAEEAMLFLMIGCVFLGAPPVGWLGRHIRMDALVSILPARVRKVFELASDLITIATCVMLAIFAWPMIAMFVELDQRSETANIPLVIPEAVLPLGLMLMALLIAVRLIVLGTRHGTTITARDIEH